MMVYFKQLGEIKTEDHGSPPCLDSGSACWERSRPGVSLVNKARKTCYTGGRPGNSRRGVDRDTYMSSAQQPGVVRHRRKWRGSPRRHSNTVPAAPAATATALTTTPLAQHRHRQRQQHSTDSSSSDSGRGSGCSSSTHQSVKPTAQRTIEHLCCWEQSPKENLCPLGRPDQRGAAAAAAAV